MKCVCICVNGKLSHLSSSPALTHKNSLVINLDRWEKSVLNWSIFYNYNYRVEFSRLTTTRKSNEKRIAKKLKNCWRMKNSTHFTTWQKIKRSLERMKILEISHNTKILVSSTKKLENLLYFSMTQPNNQRTPSKYDSRIAKKCWWWWNTIANNQQQLQCLKFDSGT